MSYTDIETPITHFANPFLRCTYQATSEAPICNRRVVGTIGPLDITDPQNNAPGQLKKVDLPSSGRNWPCYHVAPRVSVCDNWTSTTGCQHDMATRATHSNTQVGYESTRK